jgi:hypothetical protein
MDQTGVVGRVQGCSNAAQDTQDLGQWKRPAQAVGERAAGQQLGDHEGNTVRLTEVVDGQDVRVTKPGRRARLTSKPFEEARLVGQRLPHDLDRDVAVEGRVVGLVDRSHAAAPDPGGDDVCAESGPGG